MNNTYVVIDVETPNSLNNSISAIGITLVENCQITDTFYTLVNPEQTFDIINSNITGITQQMVEDKPTFPVLWPTIENYIEKGILVAHNASFDLTVLSKCMQKYQIEWYPYNYYLCTYRMSKKIFTQCENYRLKTICDMLGISYNAHHAGSDSEACAKLLIYLLNHGAKVNDNITQFDFHREYIEPHLSKTKAPSENTKHIEELRRLISDIIEDGIVTDEETWLLQNWMDNNNNLKGQFPYDKVFDILTEVLMDGIIDDNEKKEMQDVFSQMLDPIEQFCYQGDFDITGKTFCITGNFSYGTDTEVQNALETLGGIALNSVTKKTDCLVVGRLGSKLWACGNYGNKIKKALELQEKGYPIIITKEEKLLH